MYLFNNNFRYTEDSILDAKSGAIVIPISVFGSDVSYPAILGYHKLETDLREWWHQYHQLIPTQAKIVKNDPTNNLKFEWIIYTILPFYNDDKDWFNLCHCYEKCLYLAAENGITSVAFPLMGRGRIHYRPEGDLLFYVNYTINDTVEKLGGKEKFDVSVQLPSVLLDCLITLDDIINNKDSNTLYYRKASQWIQSYEQFIYSDEMENRIVISDTPARFRKDPFEYDVDEYCRNFIRRSEYISNLIREHQQKEYYDSIVNEIKEEKEAFLTESIKKDPAPDLDEVVKRFRCAKIDSVIQKWCDKPASEANRGKYSRKTNSRNTLARTVGITSQTLSDITGKYKLPTRDTLLALAVGMKLPFGERMRFCLYRDEDIKYPSTEKEKLIERILEETGYVRNNMSYIELNTEVYKRSGNKFSIYDNKKDIQTKSKVKSKDKKTKSAER